MVWASAADLDAWTCDLSPLLKHRLQAAFFPQGPGCDANVRAIAKRRLYDLLEEFESVLSSYPGLRSVGHHLLDHADEEAQRFGCIWLTLFPDTETIQRVAHVALDEARSIEVRDQAAWTLCFRQRRTRHAALYFSPEAEAAADTALMTLLERGALGRLPELAQGLRHVCAPEILDWLARDIALAKDAIECFATPAFARAACDAALTLDSGAGTSALRVASYILGDEVVPRLRAIIEQAPTLAHRIEAAQCLASLEPAALGEAERAVQLGNPFPEASLRLVRYHAAHPREFATVRGLQVARRTATMLPEVARDSCREVAEPLLRYAAVAYAAGHGHVEFLAYLVHASGDPDLVLGLFDQFGELFGPDRRLLPPPFAPLARAGRFSDLERLARSSGDFAQPSWELARHGRPFRALALQSAMPRPDVYSTAARALALFTAGRPDLARAVCTRALPAPLLGDGPFPGAEERHQMEHAAEHTPLAALVRGASHELLQFVVASRASAEPDRPNMSLLFAEAEALFPALAGKSFVLLGDAAHDQALIAQLSAGGAQVLSGPFLNADYFVEGAGASQTDTLRLIGAGVVRWTPT